MRVGIDNGNVLCESDTDYLRHGDLNAAREMPGGFDTVMRLVQTHGAGNIWIVSKCGPRVQNLSWDWFMRQNLFARTGLSPTRYNLPPNFQSMQRDRLQQSLLDRHVLFCRERSDKAAIAEILSLEAFVDDRLPILCSLPACVRLRIWFGPTSQERRPKPAFARRHPCHPKLARGCHITWPLITTRRLSYEWRRLLRYPENSRSKPATLGKTTKAYHQSSRVCLAQ